MTVIPFVKSSGTAVHSTASRLLAPALLRYRLSAICPQVDERPLGGLAKTNICADLLDETVPVHE
jgi:hypothetical protein